LHGSQASFSLQVRPTDKQTHCVRPLKTVPARVSNTQSHVTKTGGQLYSFVEVIFSFVMLL